MISLYIKLNDSDQSFEIAVKRGKEVLSTVRGNYQKDLADKLIQGISDSIDRSSASLVSEPEKAPKKVYTERGLSAKGLDKNLAYVRLKKRGKFRVYYDDSSKSFVSNLIGNSVASIFNWLEK